MKENNKYNIIITSEGGGGHKAAAEAIKEQAESVGETTVSINIIKDHWLLPWKSFLAIDQFAMDGWNEMQKSGNVSASRFMLNFQFLTSLARKFVKNNLSKLIEQKENELQNFAHIEVHNTGPLCICSMVTAVADYNRQVEIDNQQNPNKLKKKIKFINHFTDLPAKGPDGKTGVNFAYEIDSIDPNDMNDALFELRTPIPVLSDIEVEANVSLDESKKVAKYQDFMKEVYPNLYRNLPRDEEGKQISRVVFNCGPVRPAFYKYKDSPPTRLDSLLLKFTDEKEFTSLKAILKDCTGVYDSNTSSSSFTFDNLEQAEIVTVMLGSQADIGGSLTILDNEIKLSEQTQIPKYVFIFCGPNNGNNELYNKALMQAQKYKDTNIKIVPLSNQGANTIAHLYSIADQINIRPGGISSMEAKLVARKDVFAYASLTPIQRLVNSLLNRSQKDLEKIYQTATEEVIDEGFIPWEVTNAAGIAQGSNISVSKGNAYTYFNTRQLNKIRDEVIGLLDDKKYPEAIKKLQLIDEALCKKLVTGKRYDLKKAAILSLLLNNLALIKNKYKNLKIESEYSADYEDMIDNLIKGIEIKENKLYINPFSNDSEDIIFSIYSDIVIVSNEIFEKLNNDISAKNSESILESLASILRIIIAHIPFVRMFVSNSLEAQYLELNENISNINKEANDYANEIKRLKAL